MNRSASGTKISAPTAAFFAAAAGSVFLLCCQPGSNPAVLAEPIGVLLDTGKGYRRTVIEGDASVRSDRFSLPLPSAAVELWSAAGRICSTHADLNGHFAFTETLLDGEYIVKLTQCRRVEARVTALRERRFTVALLLPQPCTSSQR